MIRQAGHFLFHIDRGIGRTAALIAGFLWVTGIRPIAAQELAVLSRDEDALVFIDLKDGTEITRIAVGRMCHELAVDRDRQRAYTASYRGNTVHAIDLQRRTARALVINGFRNLHGVALSPDADVLFVTSEDPSAVLELDPITGNLLRFWPVTGLRAHIVTVAAEGAELYVGSEKPGAVAAINRESGAMKTVMTGDFVVDVRIAPDSATGWVAVRDEGRISLIDLATDRLASTFESGGDSPAKLRFRPNANEAWFTNHLGETVTVLDLDSHEVVGTVQVGERPLGLAFSDDGSRAYVSRTRASEVVEIDTATRKVLRRIPTGGNPDGMVWLP